ncbi:MAG: MFS transporter [Candidatus Pacebacteria bacterium]|nr:MFS transporter [Candidatus Paceibacterota bacterium]
MTGQAISTTGTWMQNIGLSWLVLKMTNSGTSLGIVVALQFLPMLVLGPWGGVIVDRFPKRKILYLTQTLSGIFALILAILVFTETAELWMVYVLALLLGLVNTVDNPTRQTFIPEMVGEKHLMNAISINSIQVNLTRVIGPTVAAIIIASFGLAACFFFNAISFIAVIVALTMIRKDELRTAPRAKKIRGQLKEGWHYVRSKPAILYPLIMVALIGTFAYEFTVSLPLLAQFTFGGDATTFATLSAALGLGSIFGGIVTAHRKDTSPSILIETALLFGVSLLIFALMPTLSLAILVMVVVGFFSINFLSLANVIIQVESSPEMRGRVMAFWSMAYLGSTPIGGPIIGWIGENIGPRWALIVGALATFIAVWICFAKLKKDKTEIISDEAKSLEEDALAEENLSGRQ